MRIPFSDVDLELAIYAFHIHSSSPPFATAHTNGECQQKKNSKKQNIIRAC